jgi:predicted SnoaL-like aldol condensation-catalyzing enzyme
MSADLQKAKEATIRWLAIYNTGDLIQIDKGAEEIFAADAILHNPPAPNLAPGAAGVKQFLRELYKDHTGIHMTIDDMFGEGDRLAGRYTWQAMSKSTGKKVTLLVLDVSRWAGGKIVEYWQIASPAKEA